LLTFVSSISLNAELVACRTSTPWKSRQHKRRAELSIFDIGQGIQGVEGFSYGCKHLKKSALTIAAMAIGQMAGSVSVGGEP
jgi:hypothetical protein